ncbi:diguanylate cyclase [Bacterioplanoides sp.]|uniref:diguanylate cyclase n=1 Tax=Bacterioplanoides sp. TaxID=2066072 RepID=UPI003B593632
MPKFLIVEDSSVILKILKHIAKQELPFEVLFASSMAQAKALYLEHKDELVAGLIDLALPDAPDGQLVDYLLEEGLPVVVLTGTSDGDTRETLLRKGVADYVIKETRFSYQYAIQMLHRLYKNRQVDVLVVEDSRAFRKFIVQLLNLHQYRVHEAEDGLQALEILHQQESIQLVITDYHMPQLDGFELVQAIRQQFERRHIAVIGLSGHDDHSLSVKFIKNGANDFLPKPFEQEEFFCRVTNNVEALESLQRLQHQATRDYLTGLYNRRYFTEEAEQQLAKSVAEERVVSLAMLDIDFFKKINDEYGHAAGDMVLQQIGETLQQGLGRFLVARTGGEEFSILLPGLDAEKAYGLMDGLRQGIAERIFDIPDDFLRLSVSIGVCTSVDGSGSLDQMIAVADDNLYRAKEAGRNLVVSDDGS